MALICLEAFFFDDATDQTIVTQFVKILVGVGLETKPPRFLGVSVFLENLSLSHLYHN
ncbi:hypothetical protein BGP_2162 [Beggiatoa sp. PS]|nr:hypothetical protein BGP_2162 [Beggiatoa sp. PS]